MLLKFNFLGKEKLCLKFCHYSVYVRDDNWAEMLFFRRQKRCQPLSDRFEYIRIYVLRFKQSINLIFKCNII